MAWPGADLKLLVEGGCFKPPRVGGTLDPGVRYPLLPNKVGVTARWMSSGGGGELGLGGGPSAEPRRRSGMKLGGGILLSGGGALGGGGRDIMGGLVLSTMADPEGTRERRPVSSPPALEDNMDSIDCLRSEEDSLADLANTPVESLKRPERGP